MSQDTHSEHFAAVQLVEMALGLLGAVGESTGKKKKMPVLVEPDSL